MPEGDTIHRTAAILRQRIEGVIIRDASTTALAFAAASLKHQRIASVEARGKHLLMHIEDRQAIHSHMGMTGSWHVYAPAEAWRKPASRADLVLRFDEHVAVCFSPKVLELLSAGELKHHRWLSRLGPDLLAAGFDLNAAVHRFRRHENLPLGEAVMNQIIVCGIGNVYKSEILFLAGIHPLTNVSNLTDEALGGILARARKLLKRNVMGGPRRTRFRGDGHNLWVYGRQGEACLKCGTAIGLTRQGDLGRTTYYCPTCQAQ